MAQLHTPAQKEGEEGKLAGMTSSAGGEGPMASASLVAASGETLPVELLCGSHRLMQGGPGKIQPYHTHYSPPRHPSLAVRPQSPLPVCDSASLAMDE